MKKKLRTRPRGSTSAAADDHAARNSASVYVVALEGLQDLMDRIESCQAMVDLGPLAREGRQYLLALVNSQLAGGAAGEGAPE